MMTLVEINASTCICGFSGTLNQVLAHHRTWRRRGVCLYRVAVTRAWRAGYDSYVPISADPQYYTRAWLRIRKGMRLTQKEAVEWALVWYRSDDLEFCEKFMEVGEVTRWQL